MNIRYLIDDKGKKTDVVLSFKEYKELLEKIEDAESLSMLKKIREKPLETKSFDDFINEYTKNV